MSSFIALAHAGAPSDRSPLVPGNLGDDDPFARERLIAWQGAQRMAVGQVTWRGPSVHAYFSHTELLIVQRGVLTLESTTEKLRVIAGEAVLIAQGATINIRAESPVNWIFGATLAIDTNATPPAPLVQRINFAVTLTPSAPPAATVLLSVEPRCRSGSVYADDSTRSRIGVWDSTPYTRKQVPHRVNELMYLLEGSMTLMDEHGTSQTFNRGDVVFVPHGTPCAWHSAVLVRKLYWVQEFPA